MSETIFQEFKNKKIYHKTDVSIPHILRLCYAHNFNKSNVLDVSGDEIKNIDLWRYFSGETEHTKKLSVLLSTHSLDFTGVDFTGVLPGNDDKYLSYFLANPNHKNAYENLKDLSDNGKLTNYKMSVNENISIQIKDNVFNTNPLGLDNYRTLTNLYYDFPLEFINLLYDQSDNTYDGMVNIVKDNVIASGELFDKTIIDSRLKSLTSKQDLSAQFNDSSENRLLTYKEQLIQYSPTLRNIINNFNLMRKDNDHLLYYFLWSLMNNTLDNDLWNKWHKTKKVINFEDKEEKEEEKDEEKKWSSIIGNIGESEYSEDSEDSEDSDKLRQKLEMGHKIEQKFKELKNLDTTFCKKQIADLFIEHFTCKTPYDLGKNQLSEFYKNSTELYKSLCINLGNEKLHYLRPKLSILDIAFLCDDDMDETLSKILKRKNEQTGGDGSENVAIAATTAAFMAGMEQKPTDTVLTAKSAEPKNTQTKPSNAVQSGTTNSRLEYAGEATISPSYNKNEILVELTLPQPTANQNIKLLNKQFIEYYNKFEPQIEQNVNDDKLYEIYESMKKYIYCYFVNLDFDKLSLPQYIYYTTHDENDKDNIVDKTLFGEQITTLKEAINSRERDKSDPRDKYYENDEKEKYINKEVFGALKIAWREAMINTMIYENENDNGGLIFNTDIFLKSKLIDALGLRNKSNHKELDNLLLYLICDKAYETSGLTGVPIEESFLNNTTLLSNIRERCESYKYQNLLPCLRSSLNYLNDLQQRNHPPPPLPIIPPRWRWTPRGNKARIVKNKYIKTMANRKRYVKQRSIKKYKVTRKKRNKPRKKNHSSKQIKINKH